MPFGPTALDIPLPTSDAPGAHGAECLDFGPSIFDTDGADEHLTIRSAHCEESRMAATRLLQERYRWRGYCEASLPPLESEWCFPLLVTRRGRTIGTITVGLDSHAGLTADRTFPDEVDAFRRAGIRLSEFTRLAVDPDFASRHVLTSLFQVAYLSAARLGNAERVLMEVNPRHVGYYTRMLGAKVAGPVRAHAVAGAPAVLLCIAFDDVKHRIADFLGGLDSGPATQRSPYAMALAEAEEEAILERLSQYVCVRPGAREPFVFRLAGLDRDRRTRTAARRLTTARPLPKPRDSSSDSSLALNKSLHEAHGDRISDAGGVVQCRFARAPHRHHIDDTQHAS